MMSREHPRTEPEDWTLQAACRGLDPNLFHPAPISTYGSLRQRPKLEQRSIAWAKAICATCPVGDECENARPDDTLSIRNGKLPEERSINPVTANGHPACGTDAGFRAHYRRGDRGDDVCLPCKEAHSIAGYEWKERRREATS